MTLKFTRDWTHSLNNDKVENEKIAKSHQNTASQWENAINEETCLWKESDLFVTSHPPPPPPPYSRRIRGNFACSPSPEPSYLEENIPYLGSW